MDRIRCLGNSVVPQVAEVFAMVILERENMVKKKTTPIPLTTKVVSILGGIL